MLSDGTSSLFIEFEFHRASDRQDRTHSEFKCLSFFKFKLEIGDKFSKFLPEYVEYFKFIEFEFAFNTNHRARFWSSLKFECCLNSFEF